MTIARPLPESRPQAPRPLWRWWLLLGAFWGLLACLDFPAPQIDDLCFVGAPVNLAGGGGHSNPWVYPPVGFDGTAYHYHPPFHSRLLGLWFQVAGVSATSSLLFAAIGPWLTTVGITLWLRRFGRPLRWVWLFVPPVLGFTAVQGLRQDPWAPAMLVLGSGVLLGGGPKAWLAGFSLLGAAPMFSPIVAGYGGVMSVAVGAVVLRRDWPADRAEVRRYVGQRFAMVGLAALLNFGLFLVGIEFQLALFIKNFTLVASQLRAPVSSAFPWFVHLITTRWRVVTDLPFIIAFLGLAAAVWIRWPTKALPLRVASVAMPLGVAGSIALYQASTTHPPMVCAIVGLGLVLGGAVTGWLRSAAVAFYVVTGAVHVTLPVLRIATPEPSRPEFIARMREQVAKAGDVRWGIDTFAARYVFGYRLPPKAMSWEFLYPVPLSYPTRIDQIAPGWAWMVGKETLKFRIPDCGIQGEQVRIAGRTFGSLPRYRDDLVVFGPKVGPR